MKRFLAFCVTAFIVAILAGCDETTYVVQPSSSTPATATEVTAEPKTALPQPVVVDDTAAEPMQSPTMLFMGVPTDPYKTSVRPGEQDVELLSARVFCAEDGSINAIHQLVFKISSPVSPAMIFDKLRWTSPGQDFLVEFLSKVTVKDDVVVVDFPWAWVPSGCQFYGESDTYTLRGDIRTDASAGVWFQAYLHKVQAHEWDAVPAGSPGGNAFTVVGSEEPLPVVASSDMAFTQAFANILTDVGGFSVYCEMRCGVQDIQLQMQGIFAGVKIAIDGTLLDLEQIPNSGNLYHIDPRWGLGTRTTVHFRILVESLNDGWVGARLNRMSFRSGDQSILIGPHIDKGFGNCATTVGSMMECPAPEMGVGI